MTPTSLELLGLGLRLADRANVSALSSDLFTGELSKLFEGDAAAKTAALTAWLAGIGVEWSGVQSELPLAVAVALRAANDRVSAVEALAQARRELERAEMMLRYPAITGPSPLKAVIEALLLMPPRSGAT